MDWVGRCEYKQPDRTAFPAYKGMGLNLAVAVGGNAKMLSMASEWEDESNDYKYDFDRCYSTCDHYKQVGMAA